MAPARLYQLPNEQLVEELACCRDAGMTFEAAWKRAVRPDKAVILTNAKAPPEGAVRWPTDSSDRMAWREAILSAKDEFRRAYERRPATRREIAVTVLVDVLLSASDRRARARGMRAGGAVRSAA